MTDSTEIETDILERRKEPTEKQKELIQDKYRWKFYQKITIIVFGLIVLIGMVTLSIATINLSNTVHNQNKQLQAVQDNQGRSNCIRVKQALFFRKQTTYLKDFSGILAIDIDNREAYVKKLITDADEMDKAIDTYIAAGKECTKMKGKNK